MQVEKRIKSEPLDLKRKHNTVFYNPSATKAIELSIYIHSKYKLPVDLQSFVITVPKFLRLTKPSMLVRNWPAVDNIPLDLQRLSLPHTLLPGEDLEEAHLTGLAIAQTLQKRGYSGDQIAMLGVFDKNKNVYYSEPFELNVEDWLDDCGHVLMGFL